MERHPYLSEQPMTLPVTRLTELVTVVDSISVKISPTATADRLSREACIEKLTGCLDEVNGYLSTTVNVPSLSMQKKQLKAVANTFNGLRNGLKDQEVGTAYYKRIVTASLSSLDQIKGWANTKLQEQSSQIESVSEEIVTAKHCSLQEGLELLRDNFERKRNKQSVSSIVQTDDESKDFLTQDERSELEKYREQLKVYDKFKSKIPARISHFTVFQAPILPIFKESRVHNTRILNRSNALMKTTVLNSLHIKYTKIGPFFVVYENQYILALSKRAILETAQLTPKAKQAQAVRISRIQAYADAILDQINDRSLVKYAKVSDKPMQSREKGDTVFFWIAPFSQLDAMHRYSSEKGLQLLSWNFPWNLTPLE